MVTTLLIGCSMVGVASANEIVRSGSDSAIALNFFSGEQVGQASNVNLNEHELSFTFAGNSYVFPLQNSNTVLADNVGQSIQQMSGRSGDLMATVSSFDQLFSVTVMDLSQSSYAQKRDTAHNFILISKEATAKITDVRSIVSSVDKIQESSKASNMESRAAVKSLHVLASGKVNVPFLISSGVAEGWADAQTIQSDVFLVNNVSYSIASNSGYERVSLWHDYQGSKVAWSTTNPSAGMQNANISRYISIPRGAFEASASYTALVNNVPVFFPIYNVLYMRNV